jgi:hypothetical protein
MFVCCECRVLSGRGLCDELVTRSEESYRLWCVVVCDLENLKNEEAITRFGSQRYSKKKKKASVVASRQPHTYLKPEATLTVFELLIMSGVSLETC